jgi:hypothetical protein
MKADMLALQRSVLWKSDFILDNWHRMSDSVSNLLCLYVLSEVVSRNAASQRRVETKRSRVQLNCDGTPWRTGGEVKGKLANGVGSQYSHAASEHGASSITAADAHISAASSRLNWRPCHFKWTSQFRRKTKSGFCACAITFQTQSTYCTTCCADPGYLLRDSDQNSKRLASVKVFFRLRSAAMSINTSTLLSSNSKSSVKAGRRHRMQLVSSFGDGKYSLIVGKPGHSVQGLPE